MSALNGTALNSMPGGIVTAKAIRHRYQTGQLKAKDGSWYARFYDEVPNGNGGSDRKRDGKSSRALRIPARTRYWGDRHHGQWHVERRVVEGRTGDTKTEARQEGVPVIPYLERINDKYRRVWDAPPKDRFSADG
jgi:hypothetical protein